VWRVDGDPQELDGIGLQASVSIPRLDLRRRSHFAALLNALAQYDRAALVDQHGGITTVGVHLRSTDHARRTIPPFRGTRHTSAQRFTATATSALAFVVSSNGGLSVFCRGERLRTD
jgi:DNA integrity scanning protein DisA with diadenylate cyclase activity